MDPNLRDEAFNLPQQEARVWMEHRLQCRHPFAVLSQGDDSWVPYTATGARGADSDLRTDTPSEGPASFLTYDDQER
jgi:hypothetical protein